VSIQVRGGAVFTNVTTASIPLPGAGVYSYVDITVTSPENSDMGVGGSRVYTVTILGYTSFATWTATVSNVPASFTITAVTMFDSSSPQIAIAMQGGRGTYAAQTSLVYAGKTFVVTMSDAGGTSYSTQALSPPISTSGYNRSVALNLTGVPYGLTIATATDLYNLTILSNADKSWSVIADITLPSSPAWDGPDNFTGKLYGNGHTIDLPLVKPSGSTGMFDSLGPGAGIYDLTVNAHTPAGGLYLTGATYFGGVVGSINCGASPGITLENIKVTGSLVIKQVITYFSIGGLLGETLRTAAQSVSIRHCVSELDITLDLNGTSGSPGNTWNIGGFAGEIGGSNVIISDSYSTGNININISAPIAVSASGLNVGGFVAHQALNTAGYVLRVERCYTTATVSVNRVGGSDNSGMHVGGIAGKFISAQTGSGIKNCVTLGPATSVTGSFTAGPIDVGRIVGQSSTILAGNYALSSLAGDGGLTTTAGLGVTSAGDVPWAALGYTDANGWDTSVSPPVLK
jgi:hypothetical protein